MSVFYHNVVDAMSREPILSDAAVFAMVVVLIGGIILVPSYFERKKK